MIKISAHIQKKLPLPGFEFSSQCFSAGLEVEASDADSPEAIKLKIRQLYAVLEESVNAQIAAAAEAHGQAAEHDNGGNGHRQSGAGQQARRPNDGEAQQRAQGSTSGNGNGQRGNRRGPMVPATAAQCKAIRSIAGEQNLDLAAVLAPYRVNAAEELSIRDASRLIDELKARKGNGACR